MWIIRKLWYDASENRNESGYENFAITEDAELVELLRQKTIPTAVSPWPLDYVHLTGKKAASKLVNVYKIDEIEQITLTDMD